jgi:hypothetical protein
MVTKDKIVNIFDDLVGRVNNIANPRYSALASEFRSKGWRSKRIGKFFPTSPSFGVKVYMSNLIYDFIEHTFPRQLTFGELETADDVFIEIAKLHPELSYIEMKLIPEKVNEEANQIREIADNFANKLDLESFGDSGADLGGYAVYIGLQPKGTHETYQS